MKRILGHLLDMTEADVATKLASTEARFAGRHLDLRSTFESSFAGVAQHVPRGGDLSRDRRLLIGAYFTHEYSIESAALTNPSMVAAPDQTGLSAGSSRFILSLRAIGEGHVSSVEFRTGVVDANGGIAMDPAGRFPRTALRSTPLYDKPMFRAKLAELRALHETAEAVLDALEDPFTLDQLELVLREARHHGARVEPIRTIHWLASSNYASAFDPETEIAERVLFPAGPTESHGMEDARFVRFVYDDGAATYFAPYTAYDGYRILPQLIETRDFVSFKIATLNGACARNKGIALFPRKIAGRYVALSRLDNENNFVMSSDNVRFWHDAVRIQSPSSPWETIQIGNCGSPIETEAGWLVLTHGVGPMREYAIGAILLDAEDPTRVIGCLREPLLEAEEDEREGYVPNVLYSCGSMIAGERLIVPYGVSDIGARIATLQVADLLDALTAQ